MSAIIAGITLIVCVVWIVAVCAFGDSIFGPDGDDWEGY